MSLRSKILFITLVTACSAYSQEFCDIQALAQHQIMAQACNLSYCQDEESVLTEIKSLGASDTKRIRSGNSAALLFRIDKSIYVAIAGTEIKEKSPGFMGKNIPIFGRRIPTVNVLPMISQDLLDDVALTLIRYSGRAKDGRPTCVAHGGFYAHGAALDAEIANYIREAKNKGVERLILGGHSLGGAAATVLATMQNHDLETILVTFGAPAALGMQVARLLGQNDISVFRYENMNDPVPRLLTGYFHPVGPSVHHIYFDQAGNFPNPLALDTLIPSIEAHGMAKNYGLAPAIYYRKLRDSNFSVGLVK